MTRPEVVIPMHTEVPEKIKELTDKAVILKDMEIYEVKEQKMNGEKIRVVRVPPNKPPILDEVTITTNHIYIDIKPYGLINGSEFDGLYLNDEICCYFLDPDLALEVTEKEMLFYYNVTSAQFERNRDIAGQPTYGDLIITAETRSLTIEEIDHYIEMFKEDKPSKNQNIMNLDIDQ